MILAAYLDGIDTVHLSMTSPLLASKLKLGVRDWSFDRTYHRFVFPTLLLRSVSHISNTPHSLHILGGNGETLTECPELLVNYWKSFQLVERLTLDLQDVKSSITFKDAFPHLKYLKIRNSTRFGDDFVLPDTLTHLEITSLATRHIDVRYFNTCLDRLPPGLRVFSCTSYLIHLTGKLSWQHLPLEEVSLHLCLAEDSDYTFLPPTVTVLAVQLLPAPTHQLVSWRTLFPRLKSLKIPAMTFLQFPKSLTKIDTWGNPYEQTVKDSLINGIAEIGPSIRTLMYCLEEDERIQRICPHLRRTGALQIGDETSFHEFLSSSRSLAPSWHHFVERMHLSIDFGGDSSSTQRINLSLLPKSLTELRLTFTNASLPLAHGMVYGDLSNLTRLLELHMTAHGMAAKSPLPHSFDQTSKSSCAPQQSIHPSSSEASSSKHTNFSIKSPKRWSIINDVSQLPRSLTKLVRPFACAISDSVITNLRHHSYRLRTLSLYGTFGQHDTLQKHQRPHHFIPPLCINLAFLFNLPDSLLDLTLILGPNGLKLGNSFFQSLPRSLKRLEIYGLQSVHWELNSASCLAFLPPTLVELTLKHSAVYGASASNNLPPDFFDHLSLDYSLKLQNGETQSWWHANYTLAVGKRRDELLEMANEIKEP